MRDVLLNFDALVSFWNWVEICIDVGLWIMPFYTYLRVMPWPECGQWGRRTASIKNLSCIIKVEYALGNKSHDSREAEYRRDENKEPAEYREAQYTGR